MVAAAAPGLAWAQSDPGGAYQVEEVVVTAQKRAESVKDVPGALTVLSGQSLERLGAQDLSDFATYVPGLTLMSEWAGSGQLTVRGITSGKQQAGPTVGSYLDETPYNSAASAAGGSNQLPDIDTFDIQRVEVLRGPQGTLYGASTMGGLIKYVTTPPNMTRREIGFQADLGATDGGGDYGFKAVVNAPLSLDRAALRASLNYRSSGGYVDDVGTGQRRVNRSTVGGGRVSLLALPAKNLKLRLSALYQEIEADGAPVVDVDFATRRPLHGDLKQARSVREPFSSQYQLYSAAVDWDLGWASLLSATSHGRLERAAQTDNTLLFGPVISLLGQMATGAPLPEAPIVGLGGRFDTRKTTQELRLTSPDGMKLQWLAGAFYTDERSDVVQGIEAALPSGAALPAVVAHAYALRQPSTYREFAVFANLDYRFTEAFDVAVGARWSRNRQTFGQITSGLINNPVAPERVDALRGVSADEGWTFQIKPRWRLNAQLTAYAVASSGYRPGGPNPLPPEALTTVGVKAAYGPDSLWNYELGLKGELLDRRLSFDLAAFRIDWKDIQLLSSAGGFAFLDNGGSAVSQGVEYNLSYMPVGGLTLSWNGAYTDAKLVDDALGVGGVSGDGLPTVARWTTAATADYRFPVSEKWNGSVGISYRYIGERTNSFSAAVSYPNAIMPAYDLVDLRAGLQGDRWGVTLFIDNLLDERGEVNLNTTYVPMGGPAYQIVTQPRTIGLQLVGRY